MIDMFSIICLLIIVACVIVLYIGRLRDRRKMLSMFSQANVRLVISRALKALNCKVEWKKEKDSYTAHYTYQGGHFNLSIEKDSPYARLTYLFFFQTSVEEIENMRMVCNLCNLNTDTARVVYTVDNKEGKVDAHIISVLPVAQKNIKEELERTMGDAFRWQNAFANRYKDLEKETRKAKGVDAEKAKAEYARDLELIREQEMTHQEAGPDWHESAADRKTLRALLSTAMGLTDIIPIKMTITIEDSLTTIDDPDDILNYCVSTPLIDNSSFANPSASGKLDFYDPRDPVTRRHLMLSFDQEDSNDDTLYYRVTMTLVPVSLGKDVREESDEHRKQTTSVLLGYDLTPSTERVAHFRYVWKEAIGKQQNDDTKDMTDDEKVLADMQDPQLAYNYFRGRSLYLRKRYYEALLPLTNAFHAVTAIYDVHDRHVVEMLDELAYFIGCCYMCLHQYERACYYLQLTLPTNHQSYSEAYINCLVNGGDYRALDVLNGLLSSLQMMMENMAETDDDEEDDMAEGPDRTQMQEFINFVKRRKAYLLINLGRYDEAERILKQLLDDPDNSDFALNELAYIQKSRAHDKSVKE